MFRVFSLLSFCLASSLFAAQHVRFSLPEAPSLALVQSFVAAKSPSVIWQGSQTWSSATCEAFLYRPEREDEASTLYDKDNRLECRGTDANGKQASLIYPMAKVGVQYYGDFRTRHSSTLIGEGVMELGTALNVGRRLDIGNGLYEPFNLCDGGGCADANDLMTKKPIIRNNGADMDYGRVVLTCTQYRRGLPPNDTLYRTDCYIVDVTE